VFRTYAGRSVGAAQAWGGVFGIASLLTPLVLGAMLGATATGEIRVLDNRVTLSLGLAWAQPFPLVLGALTVALCTHLAAPRLAVVARGRVREDFRRRGLISAVVSGLLSLATLVLLVTAAPRLWTALTSLRVAPVLTFGVLLAAASAGALWQHRYGLAHALGAGHISALLVAWALAQSPYIIYPDVLLDATAAPPATLAFVIAALPLGMGLVVPSLWLLFAVFHGGRVHELADRAVPRIPSR
jgi:cytochrome d ubiquinol oxidase subunit II